MVVGTVNICEDSGASVRASGDLLVGEKGAGASPSSGLAPSGQNRLLRLRVMDGGECANPGGVFGAASGSAAAAGDDLGDVWADAKGKVRVDRYSSRLRLIGKESVGHFQGKKTSFKVRTGHLAQFSEFFHI